LSPLKNDGVRQLGWFFHSQNKWKVIIHSMVQTTNQIYVYVVLDYVRPLVDPKLADPKSPAPSCAFPRRGLQLSTIELKAGPLSNQRMHAVLHLQTTRPGHLKQQNEGFTLLYRHSIEPSYRI
jgi:hypothetical protein